MSIYFLNLNFSDFTAKKYKNFKFRKSKVIAIAATMVYILISSLFFLFPKFFSKVIYFFKKEIIHFFLFSESEIFESES